MNTNDIEGDLEQGLGKAQFGAGEMMDDYHLEMEGEANRIEGEFHEIVGKVQDAVADAADTVAATAAKIGDRARDTYADVTIRVQKAADYVDPFVKQQPYLALGLAALGGLMLGLIYGGRGPKIIYVKPRL
jgi:uncharacterized protein YjbJ (UPF0337 family)